MSIQTFIPKVDFNSLTETVIYPGTGRTVIRPDGFFAWCPLAVSSKFVDLPRLLFMMAPSNDEIICQCPDDIYRIFKRQEVNIFVSVSVFKKIADSKDTHYVVVDPLRVISSTIVIDETFSFTRDNYVTYLDKVGGNDWSFYSLMTGHSDTPSYYTPVGYVPFYSFTDFLVVKGSPWNDNDIIEFHEWDPFSPAFRADVIRIRDFYDKLQGFKSIMEDNSSTSIIRRFHNSAKTRLLNCVKGKEKVLDVGVGKGSDYFKYAQLGVSTLIGIDVSSKSLQAARNRINSNFKPEEKYKLDAVFHVFDMASPDFKILFCEPVSAVVSMFSMNYVASSYERFDQFFKNISFVLDPGGIFIGIFLLGDSLQKLMDGQTKKIARDYEIHCPYKLQDYAPYSVSLRHSVLSSSNGDHYEYFISAALFNAFASKYKFRIESIKDTEIALMTTGTPFKTLRSTAGEHDNMLFSSLYAPFKFIKY